MFRKTVIFAALASLAAPAWSAVSFDEAAQLGTTLTRVGAERGGNTEGTIPEYTGGVEPRRTSTRAAAFAPIRSRTRSLVW